MLSVYASTQLLGYRVDDVPPSLAAARKRLAGTPAAWNAAAGLYRQALQLDSASAYLWCELGDALVQSGEGAKSEYCFLRGVQLAPRSPQILLAVGDFYVSGRRYRKALPFLRSILTLVDEYDSRVFIYYGLMNLNVREILESGIPDKASAHSYLRSFLAAGDLKRSEAVWLWIKSYSLDDRSIATQYVQFLFQQHLTERAARISSEYTPECSRGYLKASQVYNGGFECQLAASPFDWRISEVEGAAVGLDTDGPHAGQASLRIHFDGTHNLDYNQINQDVFVTPGVYVFEAWIRSLDITTNQGVFFRISDPSRSNGLDVATEPVRGTTAWTKLTNTFTVGPGVTLLRLGISRRPSLKFDSKISGTVWIDSVAIRPI